MASVTQWYTPLNDRRRERFGPYSLGSTGRGLYDLLGEQAAIRTAIAREQLRQMKDAGRRERLRFGERSSRDAREMRRLARESAAERGALMRAGRRAADLEVTAQEQALGEAMRGDPFATRDYRDYNRLAWLARFMPGGRGAMGPLPEADVGGTRAGGTYDPFGTASAAPTYEGTYRMPAGGGTVTETDGGIRIERGVPPPPPKELPKEYEDTGKGKVSIIGKIKPPKPKGAPTHEKGTVPGTVPETGPAKLHKGEVVVSADQVDEPLLRFLINDKLRKMETGQMDGEGTGPGKDMPSYQEGSASPFNEPTARERELWGSIARSLMGVSPEEATPTEDVITPEVTGAEASRPAWSYLLDPSEIARRLERAGRAVEPTIRRALTFGPVPGEPVAPSPVPEEATPVPLPPTGEMPAAPAFPEAPAAQGLAEGTYKGDLRRARERIAAGDYGTAEAPLTISGEGRAPMAPRGDEHLPPEERYFAPEEPRWRKAQDKANIRMQNQMRVSNLDRYLSKNAATLDPKTFQELKTQRNQIHQSMQLEDAREMELRKSAERLMGDLQKAQADVEAALAKAEADRSGANMAALNANWRALLAAESQAINALTSNEDMPEEAQRTLIRSIAELQAQMQPGVDPEEIEQQWLIRMELE